MELKPTKEPGQRSISPSDILFARVISPWGLPTKDVTAQQWRNWVAMQPIAMICRDTLTQNILSLDWKIVARESKRKDELASTIKYYTKLFERGGDYLGFDYSSLIEWLMQDLHDLPFGTAVEIGRKGDSPTGRVLWFRPLDAGTLYPTLNKDYPVMQYYQSYDAVYFPAHAIARAFISPRSEITREGWGMAPPEKSILAIEMLLRGDKYYANLLLDIPPAGILDLGDMEKDAAVEWTKAFRSFIQGNTDAFAIPILYEHTGEAKFIPFGKVPNDIMYNQITLKYAAITAAAYGISLSDIGLQSVSSSGETLAGSIRGERKTKRTGIARAKKKLTYLFNAILPEDLEFRFIDLDDELIVSLGRARLANATAQNIWIQSGQFDAKEMRLQNLHDQLVDINISEEPPSDLKPNFDKKVSERPGLLGYPQNASAGGYGEVKLSVYKDDNFVSELSSFVSIVTSNVLPIFLELSQLPEEPYIIRDFIDSSLFGQDVLGIKSNNAILSSADNLLKHFSLQAPEDFVLDTVSMRDFLISYVVYLMKELLFSDFNIEDGLDISDVSNYDNIVNRVITSTIQSFDDIMKSYVDIFYEKKDEADD